MAQLGRLDSCLDTGPGHDCSTLGRITFQNFIPSQHLAATLDDFFFYFTHEISLQLVLLGVFRCTFQFQFLDFCLTFRTSFPFVFRTFVATYVYVGRREYIHDFIDDIFCELQGLFVTATQYFTEDTEFGCGFIRTACTAQFRIRSQCCQHVSRHIDFRNNSNETFGCIGYNFFGLFLGIETTDRCTVEFTGTGSCDCFLTVGTDFGQFRIFFNLDTPSLIFGKMPVEIIDVMHGQDVDDFLQVIYREIVTAYIYHETAEIISREVFDCPCWKRSKRFAFGDRQCLVDGLDTVENTGFGISFYRNSFGRDIEFIPVFGGGDAWVHAQGNAVLSCLRGDLYFRTGHFFDVGSQEMGCTFQLFIAFRIADNGG